ncbi:MAG: EAL domain-containing protein, partial [Spirochaetales bacterium]|nr:EAL domain-containing protein [Spirochaetales bacterium]
MLVNFSYQTQFELCSLIFLVGITLHYYLVRRFPTFSNKLFGVILILSIADLSLDIIGCITIEHINDVPVWANYLVNGLFYLIETTLPMLMCIYIVYHSGMTFVRNPQAKLIIIPSLLMALIHMSNPLTGLIFSIRKTENGLMFVTGPIYYSLYVVLAIHVIMILVLVVILRSKLSFKQILTVLSFVLIVTVAAAIQLKIPSLILSGTATALSLLLWDLTLQSPETMTDEITAAYNDSALRLYLDSEMRKHHVYAAVVSIDGLANIEQGYGDIASNALQKQIGYYFSGLVMGKSSSYFRQADSCFWIIFKNQMELEEASLKLVDKFKSGWKAEGIKVDLMAKIICIITNTSIQLSSAELISIVNDTINSENVLNNQRIRLSIDSKLIAKYRRIQLIEESMRRAVKTKEGLFVCFQPIINTENPGMNTAEVLLRYNDKNLGIIQPSEFIPIVERRGLALFIDSYVVDAGCRFLAA